jgi:CheY-like chemotaxis protein
MNLPATILVAVSQPHMLLTLEHLLSKVPGTKVLTADQGVTAVHLALTEHPRLILMDVTMPDLDGYTACRMIREGWTRQCPSHPSTGQPPQVWFIAPRSSYTERDQARSVGADGWIVEPPDPDHILNLAHQATQSVWSVVDAARGRT